MGSSGPDLAKGARPEVSPLLAEYQCVGVGAKHHQVSVVYPCVYPLKSSQVQARITMQVRGKGRTTSAKAGGKTINACAGGDFVLYNQATLLDSLFNLFSVV